MEGRGSRDTGTRRYEDQQSRVFIVVSPRRSVAVSSPWFLPVAVHWLWLHATGLQLQAPKAVHGANLKPVAATAALPYPRARPETAWRPHDTRHRYPRRSVVA